MHTLLWRKRIASYLLDSGGMTASRFMIIASVLGVLGALGASASADPAAMYTG